jgi:hypothetical protein
VLVLLLNDDWIVSRVPSGRQANKLKICELGGGEGNSRDGIRVGAKEGENRGKGLKGRGLWWCPEDGRRCPDLGRFAPLWEVELDGKRGRG